MSDVFTKTTIKNFTGYRTALRNGKLFCFFDAAGYEGVYDDLKSSGLEFRSLFAGPDEMGLKSEAPYIVKVARANFGAWKKIVQKAPNKNVGYVMVSQIDDHDIDEYRRHWRKWLSVQLGDEGKMALFRFYDPRIMAAFVGTLGVAAAVAFWGQSEEIIAPSEQDIQAITLKHQSSAAEYAPKVASGLHVVNGAEYSAMSAVAEGEFRKHAVDYLRYVWWEKAHDKTNDELNDILTQAIEFSQQFDERPPVAIVTVAIVYLTNSRLFKTDWIMNAITNDPQGRGWWNALASHSRHGMYGKGRNLWDFRMFQYSDPNWPEAWIKIRNADKDYIEMQAEK